MLVFSLARPRRLKQSARSVLLWSLGVYALAAAALGLVMDRWCPAPFEKVYRLKWGDLRRFAADTPDRPLLLMLGSSRTQTGFQAGRLDGMLGSDGRPLAAYNFGVPAAGPIHEYLYLRQMLEKGIRPRLLLVEFLPPLFNRTHDRVISEEGWTQSAWASARQLLQMSPYFAQPGRKIGEWLEGRLAPWYVHRMALQARMLTALGGAKDHRPVPYTHDRWGCRYPEQLSPQQRAERAAVALEYKPSLQRFRPGEGPIRAMHDLLDCCRRERIPVVLVLTPESAEFHSWYSPECLTATRDLLEEFHGSYGVEILDGTRWLEDEDFVDGHHVAASGARKFTTRLLAELRRRPAEVGVIAGISPPREADAR
jgi:hypothetical protein